MKVQQPLLGHSSGSLAGMVYQNYNGATYMHTKTTNYHYPDTPAQQKVQGRYWTIMRQWLTVYRGASKLFPKAMPCNWNVFDIWAAGIYQAAQTYPRIFRSMPPKSFGQDKRKSVVLTFTLSIVELEDEVLKVEAMVKIKNIRRQFKPTSAHCIVINQTRQLLQYAFADYSTPRLLFSFQQLEGWERSDELRIYVALQNQVFFTNFFRLHP